MKRRVTFFRRLDVMRVKTLLADLETLDFCNGDRRRLQSILAETTAFRPETSDGECADIASALPAFWNFLDGLLECRAPCGMVRHAAYDMAAQCRLRLHDGHSCRDGGRGRDAA
jgi:hypothetical protein